MHTVLKIAADHPAFAGHFPSFPVLPGAILLDEMLHAITLARGIDLQAWHIASAKFQGVVSPQDSLLLEHEAATQGLIRFTIRTASGRVASGTLSNAPPDGDP